MGALCVFWGALSLFSTGAQARDGIEVVEKIRATERRLLEARPEQVAQVCAGRDATLSSELNAVPAEALEYLEYFDVARSLARIEARCGWDGGVRLLLQTVSRTIDAATALRSVRDLKDSGLDVVWTGQGVQIKFPASEWIDAYIRGQGISPGQEQTEAAMKVLAQKNWVESLVGVASMSPPEEASKIEAGIPERWREYFKARRSAHHLYTIEEEYGVLFFQEIKKNLGLNTLFVDAAGIGKVVEGLGFTPKPDLISKVDAGAREAFLSPELQMSAIPNWFTPVNRISAGGVDLVAMVAEMHKVALQVALDEVLGMNREQRLAMLKSPAFDEAVSAFIEKNLANAAVLRTLLDQAIEKGTLRSKEMEIGKNVYLFARQAKHFLGADDLGRPIDLEVLDVALRDVIEIKDLRKEYHFLTPEVEQAITEVLALEARSADWSEIQQEFYTHQGQLAQALALYRNARDRELTPLSKGVRDRLQEASDQLKAIGALWRITDRTRPTVAQFDLNGDEVERYKKFVVQVAKERARLFEAVPEPERPGLFAEFSKVFDETSNHTRESLRNILGLRDELGRIRGNKKDAERRSDEAAAKAFGEEEFKQEAKIELAQDEMAKKNGQIAQTAVPSLHRALSLKVPAILAPLKKFEGKVTGAELAPLLFSGYVLDHLKGSGLQELLRAYTLDREKFFDQSNWAVFYHGAIGVVFETPIWLSFYPKLALGLVRPFGRELIKSTVKNRLGALARGTLNAAYQITAFGVSTFASILHPPAIGKLMHWIIVKDLGLAALEFSGAAQIWPFNWSPTGWYRYYEPYFSASVADEGVISSKEQRNATVRFNQERQGMIDNLKVILEFKILGILTGGLTGGWTRLDAVKNWRRLGLWRSIGIAASGNHRVEADIARSWEALGGRPHELRWEVDHIERTYDAAVARLGVKAKPRDLQKLHLAKERLILELEMAQRRWEMIHAEMAHEMSVARVDRIDARTLKESKDLWDARLKEGSVGYGEYQAAMRAHKALIQIVVRTEQAIEVKQNNPKAALATRYHPSLKLLYRTVTRGGSESIPEYRASSMDSTLLRGDVDRTNSVMDATEARIENFGRATVGYADKAERESYDWQIRELQETYPNIRIERLDEADGSGRFEVVYDLKNQYSRLATNEELANALGLVTGTRLSRGAEATWNAIARTWHLWKAFKPKDHVTLEEWMTSRMSQLGLTGADGKSWYEALDPMVIMAHGAVMSKMAGQAAAKSSAQVKAIEKATRQLSKRVAELLDAYGPVVREIRGEEVNRLEILRRRSPFYRALIDRAVERSANRVTLPE